MNEVFEAFFNQSEEAFIICSPDNKVLYSNDKAKKIFSYGINNIGKEDLESSDIIKYHEDGETIYKNEDLPIIRALKGEYFSDQRMMISFGGNNDSIHLSITGFPIKNNEKITCAALILNRVDSINKEIFDLSIQSEVIKITADSLRKSNEQLSQFAMNIAHDLKTPLGTVAGFLEILQMDLKLKLSSDQNEYFDIMIKSCEKINSLIDNLLEYSKYDFNQDKFVDVNMNIIIEDIFSTVAPSSKKFGIKLLKSKLPSVKGEPVLIKHLFLNLINNSIKYRNPQCSDPTISIDFDEKNSSILVKDNGLGFPPDKNQIIFEPLYQLETKEKSNGHGLGLAKCRNIAMKHGWTISANGKINQGSTFVVVLNPGNHS